MDWPRFYDLAERARELTSDKRDAFLEKECSDSPELLDEVRRALAQEHSDDFLVPPDFSDSKAERIARNGTTVGEFKLLREIGSGGMGQVYEAHQESLGRRVAVKLLHGVSSVPSVRAKAHAQFEREARILASLDHPALLAVITSGKHEDIPWFAMPLVDGHDLDVEITRQREARDDESGQKSRRLILPLAGTSEYVRSVVELVADAADALHVAHEAGVIHRDVKSKNLLLTQKGQILVADFGLAKEQTSDSITVSGGLRGTVRYMSPEQVNEGKDLDGQTDVYSLAVVLYELLALGHPYRNVSLHALPLKISAGDHVSIRRMNNRLPRDLAVVVGKGMAVSRAARYSNAKEFAEDLRRIARLESIEARPPSIWRSLLLWFRRHPRRAYALVGAIAASLIGLASLYVWSSYHSNRQFEVVVAKGQAALSRRDGGDHASRLVGDSSRVADVVIARDAAAKRPRRAEAASFMASLDSFHTESVAALESKWDDGVGGAVINGDEELRDEVDVRSLLQAVEFAAKLQRIFPDDSEIAEKAAVAALFPVVQVMRPVGMGGTESAQVSVRPYDVARGVHGPPEPKGTTPIDLRLAPGDWRIRVEIPGAGLLEFDRSLRLAAEPIVVTPDVASLGRFPQMAPAIEPCTITLDDPVETMCCWREETATLEAFEVAEAEVSIGEYLEFMTSTNHRAPTYWYWAGYKTDWSELPGSDTREEFLELPVTGLSLKDMVAYAEWRGCRLPTHFEFERANRGANMRRTLEPGDRERVGGESVAAPDRDNSDKFRHYVLSVSPVRDDQFLQSGSGLYHGSGNVREMTSSRIAERVDGRLEAQAYEYYALGGDWTSAPNTGLLEHAKQTRIESEVRLNCGFRLARSR